MANIGNIIMQTYVNDLQKQLSVEGSILNYVPIPSPLGDNLDELVDYAHYLDCERDTKKVVADTQCKIVAEVISTITSRPCSFGNPSIQRKPLLGDDKMGHGDSFLIAQVDTDELPSIEQVSAYYPKVDFIKILLSGAEFLHTQKPKVVPLLTNKNINTSFVEWGKHLIGVYLAAIIVCEKINYLLNNDEELESPMVDELKKRLSSNRI